jgi:hypothetical protein
MIGSAVVVALPLVCTIFFCLDDMVVVVTASGGIVVRRARDRSKRRAVTCQNQCKQLLLTKMMNIARQKVEWGGEYCPSYISRVLSISSIYFSRTSSRQVENEL